MKDFRAQNFFHSNTVTLSNQINTIIDYTCLHWWYSEVTMRSYCIAYNMAIYQIQKSNYIKNELQNKEMIAFAKFMCRYHHFPVANDTDSECTCYLLPIHYLLIMHISKVIEIH